MIARNLVALVFIFSVPALAWAQQPAEEDEVVVAPADEAGRSDAPAIDAGLEAPVVVTGSDDELSRDGDSMATDADAGATPGFSPAGVISGSADAVIQGPAPSPFPEGALPEGEAVPIAGGASMPVVEEDVYRVDLGGFVQAEMLLEFFDNGEYDTTFLPREIELDIDASYRNVGRLRIDLNLGLSPDPAAVAFSSDLTTLDLFDSLIEQAFVEWKWNDLTVWGGKFNAPFGSEPIDPIGRLSLSRAWLAIIATPDLLTGAYASYAVHDYADVYLMAVNGWDLTVDNNRSITGGGGVPHRFGKLDSGWLYSGNLSAIVGVEQEGVNNVKWLIDYSASLHLHDELALSLELLYGEEEGEGYNKQKVKDGSTSAQWWGGMLTAGFHGADDRASWLRDFAAELRIEYMHDHDLNFDLPHIPRMTTLLGVTTTLRYQVVRGIDAALEYRVDFERGDVKGVSVRRNVGNIFDWFITQELVVGLIGYF